MISFFLPYSVGNKPTSPPLLGVGFSLSFTILFPIFPYSNMDTDFIERLQKLKLMAEEGEVITVRAKNREKTLEDCSLNLVGRFHTTKIHKFQSCEKPS